MGTESLAKRLWKARIEGRKIAPPPAGEALSLEAAYRLQQEYVAIADSPLDGWKVGATNGAAQAALGLAEPFAGPLFERFTRESPAEFPVPEGEPVIIEAEFVLRLGEDVAPAGDWSADRLRSAVDALGPGLEIGGARFAAGADADTALLVADAAGNGGLVRGALAESWSHDELPRQRATLFVNGERIASGTGADVLGHPMNSLAWLVKHLARFGRGLRRGDLITTGTCTGIHYAKAGDEVAVDFGKLGEARVRLVGLG